MALKTFSSIAGLAAASGFTLIITGCQSNFPMPFGQSSQQQPGDTVVNTSMSDAELLPGGPQASTRAFIDPEQLSPDAPSVYTVESGDTLWDISERFLKEPWLWPNIWDVNPQIADPHWIFPGDELVLEYVAGQPTLILTRDGVPVSVSEPALGAATAQILDADGNPIERDQTRLRLSPSIRYETLDQAIPTISGNAIQQFLVHPQVVDANTIDDAPYVIGNYDNRLISAEGHQIYVRGTVNRNQTHYGIFRRTKTLKDPTTKALLGYEVSHVADAKLLNVGDPSTLTITSNKMETIAGDILLPPSESSVHQYLPRAPVLSSEGRVVSLVNAISQTGRDQVIVLNLGAESNIQEGDVLAIESRGRQIIDSRGPNGEETVILPNQRTGVVMVFQTFDKVSYALVMESTRPVAINDIVTGI